MKYFAMTFIILSMFGCASMNYTAMSLDEANQLKKTCNNFGKPNHKGLSPKDVVNKYGQPMSAYFLYGGYTLVYPLGNGETVSFMDVAANSNSRCAFIRFSKNLDGNYECKTGGPNANIFYSDSDCALLQREKNGRGFRVDTSLIN